MKELGLGPVALRKRSQDVSWHEFEMLIMDSKCILVAFAGLQCIYSTCNALHFINTGLRSLLAPGAPVEQGFPSVPLMNSPEPALCFEAMQIHLFMKCSDQNQKPPCGKKLGNGRDINLKSKGRTGAKHDQRIDLIIGLTTLQMHAEDGASV